MKVRFLWKVTRPIQFLTAFMGTWCVALLSNAPTSYRLYASLVMGLICLGASLFHYGAARKMYARKDWDLVQVNHPALLVLSGLAAFGGAVAISWRHLPWECMAITCFDVIAISLYARMFSRLWLTKNITIALVCVTPILMGWAIGSRIHPAIHYTLWAVFSAYYAREIVKDVHDIRANDGIRVTLPMVIGVSDALRLAGFVLALSAVATCFLLQYAWGAIGATLLFGIAAGQLLWGTGAPRAHQAITIGTTLLILAFTFEIR